MGVPKRKLTSVLMGSVSVDPPSIAAGTAVNVTATVAGLTTAHKVIAVCQADLEAGLVPIAIYASAANTLTIRLYNPTAAAIDGASRSWFYLAWIP